MPRYYELKESEFNEFVAETITEGQMYSPDDEILAACKLMFSKGLIIDPQVLDYALGMHSYEVYLTPRIIMPCSLNGILEAIEPYVKCTEVRKDLEGYYVRPD